MVSHAGAARFAYNAGLAHVKESLDNGESPEWSHYDLRRWWNTNKDALAVNPATGEVWWNQNSKESYSGGLRSLAQGLSNWSKSRKGRRKGRRVGFPKFKSKKRCYAVRVFHGVYRTQGWRPLRVEAAAYWPRALHGECVQAGCWGARYPHKRVASGWALVCEFDRGARTALVSCPHAEAWRGWC